MILLFGAKVLPVVLIIKENPTVTAVVNLYETGVIVYDSTMVI